MKSFIRVIAAAAAVVLFAFVAYFLYDTLRERTFTEKLARVIHIEDQRRLNKQLETFLVDDSAQVRQKAALAVGRIGGARSGKLLMPMLHDPSLDVASTAAFALGLTDHHELAEPLLETAADLPSAVTARAVEAAGRLADSTMAEVGALLEGYLSHPSPDVREAVCRGLLYAGARRNAESLIPFIRQETDSVVQVAALYTLARLGVQKATPVFVEHQADANPFVRIISLEGLAVSDSPEAAHLLALSLNDTDPRVVAQAVEGLRRSKDKTAPGYLSRKLGRTDDEKLIIVLIDALREHGSALGVETATMHLRSGLSDNVVAAAIKYLAVVQQDRAINLIDSLVSSTPVPSVAAACAEAYGELERSGVVPRLAMLFAHEDPMVRASAFDALIKVDSENVGFYLDKALDDFDFVLVCLALDQIGRRKRVDYLPQLKSMMELGPDLDVDIRRSLVAVAGEMLDSLGRDTTVMEILIAGLLDPEYVVRYETARLYRDKLQEDRMGMVPPAATRLSEGDIEKALKKYEHNPTAVIVTDKGEIEIELYFDVAPLTVLNFKELVEDGFYNGLTFHRVVPNFVVQSGDPRGDGWGGPAWFIRCEYSDRAYLRGTVGMATSGRDTGGSQFFITHSSVPRLEARYTVFGQVTGGMDVVDRLVVGDVIESIVIREG